MFIGPAVVLLWNNFSYYLTGAGYGTQSLMYKVLTFFSQPISCFLAAGLAGSLFDGRHRLCTLINCVIGACYCSASVLIYLFFIDNASMLGVMAISAVACIITSAMQANGLVYIADADEFEKCRSENKKLQQVIKDQEDTMTVLNFLAERTNLSTEYLVTTLYINYRKAGGATEEEAKEELHSNKLTQNRLH